MVQAQPQPRTRFEKVWALRHCRQLKVSLTGKLENLLGTANVTAPLLLRVLCFSGIGIMGPTR